ncbi:MAG: class I SAM-dependent methyltransferase [Candidatus Bathyarchaeia archaeon]
MRILPKVLSEIGEVDIFIHDSEHTYNNMMFEYPTAWHTVRAGGVLLSHDVGWNSAFSDFAHQVNCRPLCFYGIGFGGLRR